MTTPRAKRTTLWHLTWSDPATAVNGAAGERVSCVVYHGAKGMELRIESETRVILAEPFDMQPRAMARTRALRESLKRRGWREDEKAPSSKFQDPSSKSE